MCRMVALLTKNCFDRNIFNNFFYIAQNGNVKPNRAEGHVHGWGVAGFLATYPTIFAKSKNSVLNEKNLYDTAINKAELSKSKFTIAHFRKASKGKISVSNSHPFVHGEWIFAHNGTIFKKRKLSVNYNFCIGTTDSELLFNYIVENIGININFVPRLVDILKYLKNNIKHTSLTFFLMNYNYFVVYREYSTKFAEPGDLPSWNKDYYTMFYTKKNDLIVFCSEPLKNIEKWSALKNSELIVINKDLEIEFDEKI